MYIDRCERCNNNTYYVGRCSNFVLDVENKIQIFKVIYVHYSHTIISCTFGASRKLFNLSITFIV